MTQAPTSERVQAFAAALNRGEIDSARRVLSAHYFQTVPEEGAPAAYEVYYELLSAAKTAMPDLHFQLNDLRQEGSLARGTLTVSGTTDGPLWGAPPTHKPFSWTVDVALRDSDGRLAVNLEGVTLPALIGTLRQIDLVPPPDQMDQPPKYPVVVPEVVLQALYMGDMRERTCAHLDQIQVYETDKEVCDWCMEHDDIWPALRMCLICGYVGCCDTSKNKHMKQHYEDTGHPIFRSIRLDEGWGWCYEHNIFFYGRTLERHYPRPA